MRYAISIFILQAVVSVAHAQSTTPAEAAPEKWYDRMSVSGDLRLRHEYIDRSEQDNANHRERFRARLKFEGQVEDNLKGVLQLASGVGEAISTNQTLDGGYGEKDIYIAMAYLQWKASESLEVLGGKVKNTLYIPGDSELLFDPDLAPEGVTLNWKTKFESGTGVFANLGTYWFDERDPNAGSTSDANQYSAQVGVNLALGDDSLVLGVGHHAFSKLQGQPVLVVGGLNGAGGNSVTGANYSEDYAVSEAFINYAMKMGLTIFANYAQNSEVDDEDTAYLAGVIYGKTKAAGDWSVGYSYRMTEKDAVLGAIKDSDFANGETDSRGHKVTAKYQVGSATVVGLTYFMNERNVSELGTAGLTQTEDYDRAQLDVVATF